MTAFYRTDRFGNPLGRLGYVYSAQRDRTTNGTDVLDISCKTQCDKGDRIVFIDSAGNPREYIITDLEQTREDSLDFTYHCSNSITELALFFIEERRSRSENAQQMLTRVLEGTRWHVGSVTTGGANNLSFYHVSAYQAILDICELWGLEWETELTISADGSHINGRSINLVPHIGSTSARRFDFGKNLVGLSRTVDSTNVITRLYPYGNSVQETDASGEATGGYSRKIDISSVNGGKTYIEDAAATLVWGVPDASGQVQPAMGMQEYDADDPATLLAMAQADLPNLTQPKVSYTATVATLGIEGVDRYGIGVGDDVYVNDTAYPTPIRLKGRVLEIMDDLVDPLSDDTQITLGNLVQTYTADMDRVSGIVDMLTSNSGIWNDAANATPSYIDSVIAGLNQQLNQTGGYVYLEPNEGLIVYDKPKDENPTMAIQLGGGYFRIANSKKSDGSWDWRTAGTGAGLVADVLVAGIIAGGSNWWNLETGDLSFTQGTIGRSDGSTYWNLTTGDFRFAPTSSIGDTGNTIGGTVISVDLEYGLSSSTSSQPTSWSTSAQWEPNRCLWSRQKLTMLDGSIKYTTPSRITDLNGMGAYTVREQYYLSTSSSSQSGGSWSYAQPAWVNGRYYWTRSEITMSDGSKQYTTPVLASGLTSGNQSTTDLDNSLNQLDVFNRLTNNGQTQGLYLSNGLLYINGQYIKANSIRSNSIAAGQFSGYVFTGAIYQSSTANNTGFKLRDSGLDMWDSNHNHTVHLDGNGGDNLLTGTFQTALNGRRVRISPDFTQNNVDDPSGSIVGSGIKLFLDGTAAAHPYIASESSVSDEGQVSAVVINGGHRGDGDPGAFLRVGERGASGDRHGIVRMSARQKYSDSSSPRSYLELVSPQSSGPTAIIRADNGAKFAGYYANSDQGYSYMYAGDSNGTVGVQAHIDTGYLYLGGYLGRLTGRGTFQSLQWRMRTGSTPHNYAGETTWTFTPAKYGTYVGVASADTEWAGIIIHPCKTNSASGMGIKLFNADIDTTVDIYAAALAWLKK